MFISSRSGKTLSRLAGCLCVLALFGGGGGTAAADDLSSAKSDAASAASGLAVTRAQYSQVEAQLAETQGRLLVEERHLQQLLDELNDSNTRLQKRTVAAYKYGNVSALEVIFESDGYNDLLGRLEFLSSIAESDAALKREVAGDLARADEVAGQLRSDRDRQSKLLAQLGVATGAAEQRLSVAKRKVVGLEAARQARLRVVSSPGPVGSGWWEQGVASWYHHPGMTAAHKTLPKGTQVRVVNLATGNSVVVTIDDRGPYVSGRILDLSDNAFALLAPLSRGTIPVRIEVVE